MDFEHPLLPVQENIIYSEQYLFMYFFIYFSRTTFATFFCTDCYWSDHSLLAFRERLVPDILIGRECQHRHQPREL